MISAFFGKAAVPVVKSCLGKAAMLSAAVGGGLGEHCFHTMNQVMHAYESTKIFDVQLNDLISRCESTISNAEDVEAITRTLHTSVKQAQTYWFNRIVQCAGLPQNELVKALKNAEINKYVAIKGMEVLDEQVDTIAALDEIIQIIKTELEIRNSLGLFFESVEYGDINLFLRIFRGTNWPLSVINAALSIAGSNHTDARGEAKSTHSYIIQELSARQAALSADMA